VEKDKEERKRSHLRLVVNNPDKRTPRPAAEEDFVPFEELVATRDSIRPAFYDGLDELQAKAYAAVEAFVAAKEWPYAFDPHHGKLMVVPAGVVAPETVEFGVAPQDEVLLFLSEDASGTGLCLSAEMILPFYSDDESVMEDALLYSPIFQYGTLFLEENRQDGLLDLIYRLGLPLFPPSPSRRLLERMFAIAGYELTEALRSLSEYPEET
jgi:hypothetical protein